MRNPYTSKAEFWHFRIEDPAHFDPGSFRTVPSRTHPDRLKLVLGRHRGSKQMSLQKLLVAKSFLPDSREATQYAKSILRDRQGWENPSGSPLAINPADEEMPQIYGKTSRIEMTRTRGRYKGQRFFHNFGPEVAQYGVPEGATLVLPSGRQITLSRRTVLLAGKRGLWGHYS